MTSDGHSLPTMRAAATSAETAVGSGGVQEHALAGPRRVGPYTVTGVLGSGGMGVVYRAEQHEPLRRHVALKLIRRGLDTDRLIARFDAERLALARMNHSGIARVFDAGASDDGRPYFVMELVEGPPLTDFCDAGRVSIRERLVLFVAACRAVQHAHQKGIVHRDLKPSNILVASDEGRPTPKIIDFGIAKAIADDNEDGPGLTRDGGFVGTPEYMSPEQAGVVIADVDTRTDVYALGVVLYELLAGRKPHRFTTGTRDEVQRVLREQTTTRPSTAVEIPRGGHLTATPAPADDVWSRIAEARQTTPERLRRLLAGDLDTIVLKAMAFDPSRRYASVDQLAEDIERYLQGQPVLARPDTWTYRTRKFVARHRYAVVGAAAAGITLVAFTVVTAVQSANVARERDRAEQALARAEAVNRFLVGMFREVDPRQALGQSLTAAQMLERASARLQTDLQDQPEVRGDLLQSLADVYKQLGRYDLSERLNVQAVALRRGQQPARLADSLDALGDVRRMAGRPADAVAPLQEALALRRRLLGPEHGDVAESMNNLGLVLHAQGRFAEAEAMHRDSVAIWERLAAREPGEDLVALGLTNLGRTVFAQGRVTEAATLFERALQLRRASLPPTNPRIGSSLYFIGLTRLRSGRVDEAATLMEEAVRIRQAALGPGHPQTMQAQVQLARVRMAQGRRTDARTEAETVLQQGAANANTGGAVLAEAELVLAELAAGDAPARARDHVARAQGHLDREQAPPAGLRQDVARLAARLEGR